MNKIFEQVLRESSGIRLIEMATRCHPSDNGGKWPMWIKIGSGTHGDGQEEHGISHAHFISKDKKCQAVFSTDNENPPKTIQEIIVIKGEIPANYKKFIVEWASSPATIDGKAIELTKWAQARDDWKVNKGD